MVVFREVTNYCENRDKYIFRMTLVHVASKAWNVPFEVFCSRYVYGKGGHRTGFVNVSRPKIRTHYN